LRPHDVLEDKTATPAELVETFGDVVGGVVIEIVDDNPPAKKERKGQSNKGHARPCTRAGRQ
jgi:(p)ppGpp synthase/HD superfamily hydrolase